MKKSYFQTILLVVFGVAILGGVIVFSGKVGSSKSTEENILATPIVIWGTLSGAKMKLLLGDFNKGYTTNVRYVEKSPQTFEQEFVESLAGGKPPDMLIIPDTLVVKEASRLLEIPYTTYPERTLRDTYVPISDTFRTPKGIVGLPLVVDPLIMYYNRTLFANAGITLPPTNWDEFSADVTLLTKKDQNSTLSLSGTALGTFDNISHSKDILTLMILEYGDPITDRNGEGRLVATLGMPAKGSPIAPAEKALAYYTSFSDPNNRDLYSWNTSFNTSREMFVAGKVAMYFGYASELFGIQNQNPNLDFDLAIVPQVKDTTTQMTFGHGYAVSIVKNSPNATAAYQILGLLAGPVFPAQLAGALNIPPARRDLLTKIPTAYYAPIFYRSALLTRSWLDPSNTATTSIFRTMVTDVTSGRKSPMQAVKDASISISQLL